MQQIHLDPPITRDAIIPHIKPRLLSAEYQAQRIENVVKQHISADLWLTWVVELADIIPPQSIPDRSYPIAPVTYDFADNFNLTLPDLLHIGYENSKTSYMCQKLGDILGALCEASLPVPEETPASMYIITTRSGAYGAAGILDPAMQHQIKNIFGSKCFCLMSSVHEVLVVPASGNPEQKHELASMVHNINHDPNIMDPKDILSDHIFCLENDTLAVVV